MHNSNDFYDLITSKIIADLEKGQLTWRKPWSDHNLAGHAMLPLRHNGIPYTGINTIMLWGEAADKGFLSPFWLTYKQATDLKANIRKGERGSKIVYTEKYQVEDKKSSNPDQMKTVAFLKVYTVFNADQCEGLPEKYSVLPEKKEYVSGQKDAGLEEFIAATKATIVQGYRAAYRGTRDDIEMPPFESFTSVGDYYATLTHELTHWTKHEKRLNRDFNRLRWGDEGYAKEELVAELGACFLGAMLGFKPKSDDHHAAYLQSWLRVLKDDKKFIFQAARHAQQAVEFLGSFQPINSCTPSGLEM